MPPARVPENKHSSLLTLEENQQIARLLGVRCQTLSTSVVQLFVTYAPQHSQWIKKDTGVLCFVKDNIRKNYFFRIFCFKKNQMIWEHEMYNNMDYIASLPYLHTFEGEDCMVAFNFADVNEARDMKNIVESKIQAKRRKEERRSKNNLILESPGLKAQNKEIPFQKKYTDPATKKAKRKRNITKADIGNPSEFRHISHVGWDPNKGFDVNTEDAQLNDFFKKAGVSETELRDTETRKFIYDFIAANGGREACLTEQIQSIRRPPPAVPTPPPTAGPPVPPRGAPRNSHNRVAPPPPPSNTAPSRPPPATPRSLSQASSETELHVLHDEKPPSPSCECLETQTSENEFIVTEEEEVQSSLELESQGGVSTLPPPPVCNAPPPPPPPPLPPMDFAAPPPPPPSFPQETQTAENCASQPDARSALLESIQRGTTLKPVEERKLPVDDIRGDLLCEIRRGFQLKPANEREFKPVSPCNEPTLDLAGALARALAERKRVIHSEDDSTSDTESDNDDEWDA